MEDKGRESGASAAAEGPRRRSAPKRKASNSGGSASPLSSQPSSKRLAKERSHSAASASRPPLHNGPLTRAARQSPNKFAAAAASASASACAIPSSSADPQNTPDPLPPPAPSAVGDSGTAFGEPVSSNILPQLPDPAIQAEFDAVRSRDANAHVVPAPAGWFSWTKVHPIEERALTSFFNGKSEERTPDKYMELRNAIMKKFHKDPRTMIELKDLSELSVGDSDSRQQVMGFLDHWGLINFHPFPPQQPPPPDSAPAADDDEDGAAKAASLIEKLYHFEAVQPHLAAGPDLSAPALLPRLLPESAIADDLVGSEGPAVEYHCNSCSADCSRKRYHCQTQADFDLCIDCYNDGKFGSRMVPADFILMEHAEVTGANGGSWTDQETLLLLEALELYGENWTEIAEHVATKTRTQCILHFVQMPIEDSFLASKDDDSAGHQSNNADPSSMNKGSSGLDVSENPGTKTAANDEQPVPSSTEISKSNDDGTQVNVDPSSANKVKDSSAFNVAERTDIRITANEEPPIPCPMNTPKPMDEIELSQETTANFAQSALMAAFQTVGSLPTIGGSLSFAEAGNPVMTLAAFLAGLVEPDFAAASARYSLKAMAADSPNIQLAARHCFLLEDPPSDKMDNPASDSAATDMCDGEAYKEEKQTSNAVSAEKESVVTIVESKEKINIAGSGGLPIQEEVTPSTVKEPSKPTLAGDVTQGAAKESSDIALSGGATSSNLKEPTDLSMPEEVAPNTTPESGDLALQGENAQSSDMTKVLDMGSVSVTVEDRKPQKKVGSNLTIESGDNIGGNDAKVMDGKNDEIHKLTESKEDHNIDRIKRAAVTTLSAAAVKAKLIADQEEEQIRELVALLIEKQLHKVDTKLALFTEMDSAIMRAREQLDRARQRLYHERAQIIAARLGLTGPTSRPMPPSLPTSKTTNYANSVSKPLHTASQKPPVRRTMKTSNPPSSSSPFPGTVIGSSPPDQSHDVPSSIGTNTGS